MIGTRKSGPCRNYLKNDSKGPSCCVPDQVRIGNFLLGHTLLLPDQVLIIHRACLISFLLGLAHCPAWLEQRDRLKLELALDANLDVRLSNVVEVILQNKEKWLKFVLFANSVMTAKEEEERRREGILSQSANISSPSSLNS
ncbi:unnamed protein product [Lasius platythorax]|uniref:Uncharacterized protein n=1 Tax=Lasius platythorax TaxID=488582 RepID=A0AAV2MX12_9HYME